MARPSVNRTCIRVSGVAIALLSVGVLAACSGSTSGGGSPTSPASTPTDTTTATATVTTSAAPPATRSATHSASGNGSGSNSHGGGSGADTSAYCKESQLRASIENTSVPGSGKHGRKAVIVDFRNKSNSTCVLYGYPGAAVLNASRQQVTQAKRTVRGALLGYAPGHNSLVHVSLEPGSVAKAGIEGTDQQEQGAAQAGCDATANPQIEVTPPNTRIAVPFDVSWPVCDSFTVHPVNYS